MLEHPWLSMPDDYNYKMSDLEFKKYKLRQTIESTNQEFLEHGKAAKSKQDHLIGARNFECNVSDLADSDSEINGGDREDNITLYSDEDTVRSMSLSGDPANKDAEDEFNLNVSFTGGYVPNTDLCRVDKGQGNP